jgi:hypothetical protein
MAGAYAVATSIPNAVTSLGFALSDNPLGGFSAWISVIGVATAAACGVGIVAFRRRLARLFTADSPAGDGEGTLGAHAAGISVVGTYLFARGVADFLCEAVIVKFGRDSTREPSVSRLAEAFAYTTVGLALFLGSRGLVGLWRALRRSGHDENM